MEPPSCRIDCLNPVSAPVRVSLLAQAMECAFDLHGHPKATACLLLTDSAEIQDLNRRFRSLDSPTDVLTFPSGEQFFLGDVAIAVPYAAQQADKRGVSLEQELAFLAIHGALHLLGFDDETEGDRAEMVVQMNQVAEIVGIQPDLEWASILHAEAM